MSGLAGMTQSSGGTLPMYPGYGLGSVIHKAPLEIPLLSRAIVQQQQTSKLATEESRRLEQSNNPGNQGLVDALSFRIGAAEKTITKMNERIRELMTKSASTLGGEALPIDPEATSIRVAQRAFPADELLHVILSHNNQTDTSEKVNKVIENFVSDLCLQDIRTSTLVSPEMIRSLARNVHEMLKAQNEVALIGAYVSLPRVRTMDPIVLRRGEGAISQQLKQDPYDFSVITEVVLGGVFIGFGKSAKISSTVTSTAEIAKISVFSFISQGAIPEISKKSEEVTLWQVYCDWKKTLLTDPSSGYPVAMKVRELAEVLIENGCQIEPKKTPVDPKRTTK